MKVSVIMANYRGAKHLFAAINAVLRQSHADLELIVADDASPDDSAAIVRQAIANDSRVRLIEAAANSGPSATRNRALDAASGDWIAIVDSDDLLHPERLQRLLAAANRMDLDIIADDLVFFGETVEASGRTLLQPLGLCAPLTITPDLFLDASGEGRKMPALGYLKPLIRRSLIGTHRYDQTLRIGEDYDFILRLLLSGARFAVLPDPMYLYRRHGASISHRLTKGAADAMLAAHDRVAAHAGVTERVSMAQRRRGLVHLVRYETWIALIRDGRHAAALTFLLRYPGLVRPAGRSVCERLARTTAPTIQKPPADLRLGLRCHQQYDGMLSVACLAVPQPGDAWSAPPCEMAAALSQLQARYQLTCMADDAAGAWAAGLLPLDRDSS
jgi:succinoglycan biosynthesis protein ExoO